MTPAPTRTLYLADRFEHASALRTDDGNFLGVVEGKATYVRHADAWQPCERRDVFNAFFSRGRLMLADVHAPPAPPPPKDKAQ